MNERQETTGANDAVAAFGYGRLAPDLDLRSLVTPAWIFRARRCGSGVCRGRGVEKVNVASISWSAGARWWALDRAVYDRAMFLFSRKTWTIIGQVFVAVIVCSLLGWLAFGLLMGVIFW